jgi:hypothetical protein
MRKSVQHGGLRGPISGVAGDRPEASALRRAWLRWSLGAAAAMLVGGFLAGGFVAARYEARLGQMAREAAELRARARRQDAGEDLLRLLEDPSTRVVAAGGAGPAGGGVRGRLVWNDAGGGRLVLAGLPALPSDRVYRAWVVRGGRAQAAGDFRPDASGRAIHALPAVGGAIEAVSVTVEPATAATAPGGPVVLQATLSAPTGERPEPAPPRGILEAR